MNDKKERKKKKHEAVMEKALNVISLECDATDPSGMYTGVPENPYEKPVQDADDL